MPSELKSEQARINGRKSQGPKTEQGKRAAAAARFKHGLYSVPSNVLPFECLEARELIEQGYIDYWQPTSEPEMFLVKSMAEADWMLRRFELIRDSLFQAEYEKATRTPYTGTMDPIHAVLAISFENMANQSRALAELTRQERHFRTAKRRAIDELVLIRAKAPITGRTQPSVVLEDIAIKKSNFEEIRQHLHQLKNSTDEPKIIPISQNNSQPPAPNPPEGDPRLNELR